VSNDAKALFETVNPPVKDTYDLLMEQVERFGPQTVEPKKTSIHVNNGSAFLGIHPKKNWLDITIVTVEPINSERVRKTEQVSKNRFHNELRLEDAKDVDDELVGWLHEAYSLKN
jgi:hypothetical protein